jgi:H+/Cl- antiporter ClcA
MGFKISLGIFIPSLVWGALFGRILGIVMSSIQQNNRTWALFNECPVTGLLILI